MRKENDQGRASMPQKEDVAVKKEPHDRPSEETIEDSEVDQESASMDNAAESDKPGTLIYYFIGAYPTDRVPCERSSHPLELGSLLDRVYYTNTFRKLNLFRFHCVSEGQVNMKRFM
jgi:hypothetical protein